MERSSTFALGLGFAVAVALGLGGFFLVRFEPTHGMGVTMFIVTPFASGFATGFVARNLRKASAAAVLAVLCVLSLLVVGGLEGLLCAIMASPLLFAAIALGVLLGAAAQPASMRGDRDKTFTAAVVLAIPFVLAASHHAERPRLDQLRAQVVVNEAHVAADAESAWNATAPSIRYVHRNHSSCTWACRSPRNVC